MKPAENRTVYASTNAIAPRSASEATWSVTSRRLCRLSIVKQIGHVPLNLTGKPAAVEPQRVGPNRGRVEREGLHPPDSLGEGCGRGLGDQRSGHAVHDGLAGAADAERDDRSAAR